MKVKLIGDFEQEGKRNQTLSAVLPMAPRPGLTVNLSPVQRKKVKAAGDYFLIRRIEIQGSEIRCYDE